MKIVEFMEHIVGRLRKPSFTIEVYFGKGIENTNINELRAARPIKASEDSDEKWEFESTVTQMIGEIVLIDYHCIRRDLASTSLLCKYHFYYDYFHACIIFKRVDMSDVGEDIYLVDGHRVSFNSIESVAGMLQSYMD